MAKNYQNLEELPSYQHLILGGVSGAMGKGKKERKKLINFSDNFTQVLFLMHLLIQLRLVFRNQVQLDQDGKDLKWLQLRFGKKKVLELSIRA